MVAPTNCHWLGVGFDKIDSQSQKQVASPKTVKMAENTATARCDTVVSNSPRNCLATSLSPSL
ncbi:MAG: tail fiber protein [Bradyrhizobium sp.]|nr:tail fiber protein [Bradyrhizobium sp.]